MVVLDGSATVVVTGGVGPYNFNWNVGGQSDSIAINLSLGDYIVTVTDANSCTAVDTVTVTEPPVMVLSTEVDSVSCNGAADGTATVIVNGGVSPYNYIWDANAANQITPTALGLDGGTYSVTVSDANGCQAIAMASVVENPAITLMITGTPVNCNGGMGGTATVTAQGGTGTYTYQWNDPTQTTNVASGQMAGMASVIVTDSDGCFANTQFMITEPTALQANTITTPTLCNGDNNGLISVITSGGTPPYTYEWSDNPVIDSTRNDLIAGDYFITVTDANGCEEILTETVGEPTDITLSFTDNDATCFGNDDGFATVNPNGGDGNYTFQWDANANNQITQIATTLTAGTYFVTVTDGNNCTATGSVDVGEPLLLELSSTQVDVACFGNSTGNIDLDVQGGTTPYNFAWNGPNSFTAISEDIDNLAAGDYTVVVMDGNNCTATTMVSIIQPPTGIMSTMSAPDTICFQAGTGSAAVSVGGGTGPYLYDWSNGMSTASINNLDEGIYFVTITDNGNCTFVDTAYVTETPEISIELLQTGSFCHDGNDGSATIDAIRAGGIAMPFTDYNIQWDIVGQSGTTVNNLTGGQTYSVTVTDARGCTAENSITIDNPSEIESGIEGTKDASCFGGNDGEATAVGIGGSAPYTFQWDASANNQVQATASNLSAGTYQVTITDDNGCFTVNMVTIDQPERLTIAFNTTDVECSNGNEGVATATISGGTPAYSYEWSNGATTAEIDTLNAGDYGLTVTDNQGCTTEAVATINEPVELTASIIIDDVTCFDGRDGRLTFVPSGGTPPYTYSLDGENFSGADVQVGLIAGEYPTFIMDGKGCIANLGVYEVFEPDPIEVNLGDDIYINFGDSIQLNPAVANNQGSTSFTYTLADSVSLSCWYCARPFAGPEYTTQYELVVQDENGCIGEDRITVYVEKDRQVFVATGFSPNGDQINDLLYVHGRLIEKVLVFRVFDRWGNMVYQDGDFDGNDATRGWDGTFKGKMMNPGVFVWYAEVEFEDGVIDTYKGNTTLLR